MRARNENMLGDSSSLTAALDHLSQLAAIERPVLILGERGTGKELAAERLHFLSARWDAPFLKVNCAAMAESLLESELFGHEAGAFTGATRQHVGRFERADGGTLLLDEIGTMSPRLQEQLLRVIEYGEFERLGGQKTLKVDVRVIGSTHADLRAMAERGDFRYDLLDRLSFDVVHLPPLRARGDDVILLAEHFAVQLCSEIGWPLFPGFSENALAALRRERWPGNIRELKNAVERSIFRWGNSESPVDTLIADPFDVLGDDWATEVSAGTPAGAKRAPDVLTPPGQDESRQPEFPIDLRHALADYERSLLQAALEQSSYNQAAAAKLLQLSYNQIRGLVRKYDITSRPPRRES